MTYEIDSPSKTNNPSVSGCLNDLKGVGPKSLQKLYKLGIFTLTDLIFHLPLRYEDRTTIKPLSSLKIGESALIEGTIVQTQLKTSGRKSLVVRMTDGSRFFTLRFLYFTSYQEKSFTQNKEITCFGEIRRGPDSLEMIHPDYSFTDGGKKVTSDSLTPVYPTTDGLPQKLLRNTIEQAIDQLIQNKTSLRDLLPESLEKEMGLPNLRDSLVQIHRPPTMDDTTTLLEYRHPAQKRLIIEELIAHHLSMKQLRQQTQQFHAPIFSTNKRLSNKFVKNLPYKLTNAQLRVIDEIFNDLTKPQPMLRLVQGDVGSGKTVVAMATALQAIENGWQVAFMAPTEMLAEQHLENIKTWASPLSINIGWLTGKVKNKQRKLTLSALESGEIQLIVGTHALFQTEVIYHKLGFIIVDEQHRFGVHQRLALKEKSMDQVSPHQLVMTATPIPRTLAMTAYADLDISIIDELPKGRQTIDTIVLPESRREQIIDRVNDACLQGRQAYWVCPLIEESETLNCQAAEKTASNLQQLLTNLKIGLVHGRMKSEQKSQVMGDFKQGKINLLVATTVIEVGVDVPNASLMIIENAERLGLSQLHQLRGRVGRGTIKSNCVLMFQGRLSKIGRERLSIMRETNDGFAIAERDLEIRGPGELLGTKQTGLLQLRVADISRDQYLFKLVERTANLIIRDRPEYIEPLIKRWINDGLQYGNV